LKCIKMDAQSTPQVTWRARNPDPVLLSLLARAEPF
jgi:hypothetical protein